MNIERGINDEDIKKYEEDQKKIYLENKFTNKFRITSGGSFKDFDDIEEAIKYLRRMVLKHAYASMNTIRYDLMKNDNR